MNKRKLKPQVKVILIILGSILALILLENIIIGINTLLRNFSAQREYNKQQELYEQTPEYKQEKYIAESVEKTINYIKEENYEELFKLIDPEYKEVFAIDSVEKFKEIVKDYIGEQPKDVTLLDYGMQNGRYVCSIAIQKEGVLENTEILVTPLSNGEFNVVLDNVRSIKRINNEIYTLDKEIEYNLKYIVEKNDERFLIFDVKNKTSKNIVGSYENTILRKTDRRNYELKNVEELQKIELPSNETVRISFVFDNTNSYAFPDDMINMNFRTENGNEINRTINLISSRDY